MFFKRVNGKYQLIIDYFLLIIGFESARSTLLRAGFADGDLWWIFD